MSLFAKSNWDYIRVLAGTRFRVGMSERDMWAKIVPTAKAGDNINDLLRKWNGNTAHDGFTNWDWLRLKVGASFRPADTINDLLRKLATAHPNGYP